MSDRYLRIHYLFLYFCICLKFSMIIIKTSLTRKTSYNKRQVARMQSALLGESLTTHFCTATGDREDTKCQLHKYLLSTHAPVQNGMVFVQQLRAPKPAFQCLCVNLVSLQKQGVQVDGPGTLYYSPKTPGGTSAKADMCYSIYSCRIPGS